MARFVKVLLALSLLAFCGPVFATTCWVTPLESMRTDDDLREIPVGNFSQDDGTKITVLTVDTITITEQSGVMPDGTQIARVVCDIQVFFAVGFNPTATTSDNYLPADSVEYFGIEAGHRFAFCDADCM